MNELLLKYLDYIVEHYLHNDAGIRSVRDSLQGSVGIWALALKRYSQVMGDSDAGYLEFRKKWAWDDEKVADILASESGTQMRDHIDAVALNFREQDTSSAEYTLGTGSLRRSLNTQINLYKSNWSVLKFAPALLTKLTKELQDGRYPDPPDAANAKKFYRFLRKTKLDKVRKNEESAWKTSPTNAAPGLSDHGRLSAVDFVIKRRGNAHLGADSSQIPLWRRSVRGATSFAARLKNAIEELNLRSPAAVFDGPLVSPDEPWHYTYLPIKTTEDADN